MDRSVKMIEVKNQVYFKEYKNLVKLCLKEGELLPDLLDVIDIPSKYDFTESEKEKLKISKESSELRQRKFQEKENKLGEIKFEHLKQLNEDLTLFYNDELMSFIAKYPVYQKILK